jgi:hypothetical protein
MQLELSPVKWDGVLTPFCGCTHYVKTKWTVNVSGAVQGNSEGGNFTSLSFVWIQARFTRVQKASKVILLLHLYMEIQKTAHIKLTK